MRIELLHFVNNGSFGHGATNSSGGFTHLSSRYEFFKDREVDELVADFVANISYNSQHQKDPRLLDEILEKVGLKGFEQKYITTLSNGQFRRARIAKSLYGKPDLLMIEDPFLGLDPVAKKTVSSVLEHTAAPTTVCLGLKLEDEIPQWIEKVAVVDHTGIIESGNRADLVDTLNSLRSAHREQQQQMKSQLEAKVYHPHEQSSERSETPLLEMSDVNVVYRGKPALKNLNWVVRDGEKWHIRGRNGSGKTTLLSLITLDHPQAWNKHIKMNGVPRATGKTNYFDTNKQIGLPNGLVHTSQDDTRTERENRQIPGKRRVVEVQRYKVRRSVCEQSENGAFAARHDQPAKNINFRRVTQCHVQRGHHQGQESDRPVERMRPCDWTCCK
ncbi:hypothetical protein KL925_002333 [Ogataea polymorpha]|nr:hypothetical protein KL925_002333 [Ogataea polymorpha]